MSAIAFFEADPEGCGVVPTEMAQSMWSSDQMHGVAVSGALARGAEQCLASLGRDDVRPVRYSVELFRPARMTLSQVHTEVVRESNRLVLIDVSLHQDGEKVARASVLFLRPAVTPDGELWRPAPDQAYAAPPLSVAPPTDQPRVPYLRSDRPWSQNFPEHQNPGRKSSWHSQPGVVVGEKLTPFQAVASAADGASMVLNWGTAGVEHINIDITLSLTRLPEGTEVGMTAIERFEDDGIAVGTVAVFDRGGVLGTVNVTALSNTKRTVNFDGVHYEDDGARRDTPPS